MEEKKEIIELGYSKFTKVTNKKATNEKEASPISDANFGREFAPTT